MKSMANEFYSQDDQRAARVDNLFATIAPRYDLMNDLQSFGLHRWWKGRLVGLAGVRPGESAIDLCCGTGDIVFALAQRGARTIGLDFNGPMLAVAKHRSRRREAGNRAGDPDLAQSGVQFPGPVFLRGDAQQIPFPDNSFEIVTVGYGLRNLVSWEAGLHEMQRVAKPGGRLLVLEFGKPDNKLWRSVYFAYLKIFIPVLGRIFCNNAAAYAYILESLKHYPAQSEVAKKMRELGLNQVRTLNYLGGVMSINYGEKAKSPPAPGTA